MIEIVKCKVINKGALIAEVSLHIPQWHMTIHKIMIFGDGQKRWLSMPSERYEDQGRTKYYPLIKFDSTAVNDRFRDSVLRSYDNHPKEDQ